MLAAMSSRLIVLSAALPLVLAAVVVSAEGRGAKTEYIIHCQGCHLENGVGRPPDIPTLTGQIGYLLQIPGGREYLIQVPGASNAPLSDGDLAGVLNYIVQTYAGDSMPERFVPYTEAEVTRYRADAPIDIDAIRHRLKAKIAARFE